MDKRSLQIRSHLKPVFIKTYILAYIPVKELGLIIQDYLQPTTGLFRFKQGGYQGLLYDVFGRVNPENDAIVETNLEDTIFEKIFVYLQHAPVPVLYLYETFFKDYQFSEWDRQFCRYWYYYCIKRIRSEGQVLHFQTAHIKISPVSIHTFLDLLVLLRRQIFVI
jgi:hypothetical protein